MSSEKLAIMFKVKDLQNRKVLVQLKQIFGPSYFKNYGPYVQVKPF